jgi:hypothetical protein
VEDPPPGYVALTEDQALDLATKTNRAAASGSEGSKKARSGRDSTPQHRPERHKAAQRQKQRTRPSSAGAAATAAAVAAASSLVVVTGGGVGHRSDAMLRVLPRGRPAMVAAGEGGRREVVRGLQVACPCTQPVGAAQLAAAQLSPLFCAEAASSPSSRVGMGRCALASL